jgi:hypothetical protein
MHIRTMPIKCKTIHYLINRMIEVQNGVSYVNRVLSGMSLPTCARLKALYREEGQKLERVVQWDLEPWRQPPP